MQHTGPLPFTDARSRRRVSAINARARRYAQVKPTISFRRHFDAEEILWSVENAGGGDCGLRMDQQIGSRWLTGPQDGVSVSQEAACEARQSGQPPLAESTIGFQRKRKKGKLGCFHAHSHAAVAKHLLHLQLARAPTRMHVHFFRSHVRRPHPAASFSRPLFRPCFFRGNIKKRASSIFG